MTYKQVVEALNFGLVAAEVQINKIDSVPTAVDIVVDLHEIGSSTRKILEQEFPEMKSSACATLSNAMFHEISSSTITDADLGKGKHHVDEVIKRNAVAYGILSGIACDNH